MKVRVLALSLAFFSLTTALSVPLCPIAGAQLPPSSASPEADEGKDLSESIYGETELSPIEVQQIEELINRVAGIDRSARKLEQEAPETIEREKAAAYNHKVLQDSEKKLEAFGARAIPIFIAGLSRSEHEVSQVCTRILVKLGAPVVRPIATAYAELSPQSSRGKNGMLETLRKLGSATDAPLLEMINSSNDKERILGMQLIGELLPPRSHTTRYRSHFHQDSGEYVVPAAMVPIICNAAADGNDAIRRCAAETLGHIGPRNDTVIQTLYRIARKDPSEIIRRNAVTALGELGVAQSSGPGGRTVEVLEQSMLTDEYEGTRAAAARALGRMTNTTNAVKAIIKGLNDPVLIVKDSCMSSLEQFGPAAAPAVPTLMKHMETASPREAQDVARLLARIGPAAAPALPVMIRMSSAASDQWSMKYAICDAGRSMGPKASSAVPTLIEYLQDTNSSVRYHAIDALGEIGPAATSAIPALQKIAASESSMKSRAERAIRKIKEEVEPGSSRVVPGTPGFIVIPRTPTTPATPPTLHGAQPATEEI